MSMRPLRFRLGMLPLALFGVAVFAAAHAAPPRFDEAEALKISQGAIGKALGHYELRNREGRAVRLSDYRGKPLVVSMIYTSCPHVCPVITQHLKKAVKIAQEALGADSFAVVTIGFDSARDVPQAMANFARAQGADLPNWEFLSGDAATVRQLSRDLGFLYFPSLDSFDHLTQTTMVDAEGKVSLQVYGEEFDAVLLTEPLKRLVAGVQTAEPGLAGLSNQIRLFCTVYDPSTGAYRRDYSFFIGLGINLVFLVALVVWIVRLWIKAPRRSRA